MSLQDFTALRQRLGYSAREVAQAFGLHPNYISRIERGDRPYKRLYYLALLGLERQKEGGEARYPDDGETS